MLNSSHFLEAIELIYLRKEEKLRRKDFLEELRRSHRDEMTILEKKRQEQEAAFKDALSKKQHNLEKIRKRLEDHTLAEQQKNERELEALYTQTRRNLRVATFNAIKLCQETFREKYSLIVKLLLTTQRSEATEHNNKLKDLIEQFEQLIGRLKSNDNGPAELSTAQRICESIEALEQNVIADLEARKFEAEEIERQQQLKHQEQLKQEQLQQKQLEIQKQQVKPEGHKPDIEDPSVENIAPTPPIINQSNSETTVPNTELLAKDETLLNYARIMTFYQEMVDKVKTLKNDEAWKKYRFACQKSINLPINAISAASPQHLRDKFEKLYGFLNGAPANEVRVTDHPLGREYCLLLMAKKFVSQGASVVSSNSQAAYPVASIVISLWKLVPEFGNLFLAYLYKESPFMVPCLITEGMTIDDAFLKRQAGVTRLYAAIIISNGRQTDGQHPHGLFYAWRWLTKIVSSEQLIPDLCATIIMEFLQIVSAPMLKSYGKQFIKLLVYIQSVYFPLLSAIDKGGPKARLELLMDKFLKEGKMELPVGMLPPGYW